MATSPYDSGQMERSQGISRAGSGPVRATMIQLAWLWIQHQPKSAIAQWFVQRTERQNGRIKRIMIVAVARKLAIALWRYLEQGLVPQGATLTRCEPRVCELSPRQVQKARVRRWPMPLRQRSEAAR